MGVGAADDEGLGLGARRQRGARLGLDHRLIHRVVVGGALLFAVADLVIDQEAA
jgi:hypothetical protein